MSGVILSYGLVSIYRVRDKGIVNQIPAPTGYNWGTIYQISPYGMTRGAQVGQSILYNGDSAVCVLAISNHQIPIIPDTAIIATEIM